MFDPGDIPGSSKFRISKAYIATETALVECEEGKPYSKAADPDMVILWRGGESGRGRHKRSLMKPLKNTPAARIWVRLHGVSRGQLTLYGPSIKEVFEGRPASPTAP